MKVRIKMNLPNKITIFRILLIPIVIIIDLIPALKEIIFFEYLTLANVIMLVIFLIGAFSDFLDGYLARKNNIVTSFGKFMDPLADKLLVFSLLILLLNQKNQLTGWVVIVMLAREFMVSGLRMLAAEKGNVIAAGMLGRIKTNIQFLLIVLLLLFGGMTNQVVNIINSIVMYLAVIFTLWSGIDYMVKGKNIVLESK